MDGRLDLAALLAILIWVRVELALSQLDALEALLRRNAGFDIVFDLW